MGKRKRRSDYGSIQATERDLALLAWIADQYGVSVDHLQLAVEARKGQAVSPSTIKWLTGRWLKAGWVERRKLLAGRPQWVWLTRRGLREMGLPHPYLKPGIGRLNHIYHTNAVRLHVERTLGEPAVWESDRLVNRTRRSSGKRHRVDGVVTVRQTRVGVEVELSQKSQQRLAQILRELARDYETVWYFVNDIAAAGVEQALAQIPGHETRFVLYPLAPILAEL